MILRIPLDVKIETKRRKKFFQAVIVIKMIRSFFAIAKGMAGAWLKWRMKVR